MLIAGRQEDSPRTLVPAEENFTHNSNVREERKNLDRADFALLKGNSDKLEFATDRSVSAAEEIIGSPNGSSPSTQISHCEKLIAISPS